MDEITWKTVISTRSNGQWFNTETQVRLETSKRAINHSDTQQKQPVNSVAAK